jgi:ADP-heptose:LPS heptosyltransferase
LTRRSPRAPVVVTLRALGLGDILTALPAFRALRAHFAGYRHVVVAPRHFEPLLLGEGVADEVCNSRELEPIDGRLHGPDCAVDLHGRGPASQPLLLALEPRRLIAFAHPALPRTAGGPCWRAGEHEVHRWCRMLSESGIRTDPDDLALGRPPGPPPPLAEAATVIHPGAASAARRWPPDRFAAVARREQAAGRPVVITGDPGERPLAERVAALAGVHPTRILAGRTDLMALVRVVSASARVVCGDTGISHLATALAIPSVTLFGPVPPSEWGPPPDRSQHVTLWAGHRGDPHGDTVDQGLLRISVIDVFDALDSLDAQPLPRHSLGSA